MGAAAQSLASKPGDVALAVEDKPASKVSRDWSSWIMPAPDGKARLELAVEGITCAACIGEIERAMRSASGICDARVNVTDRRLTLIFVPGTVDPEALVARLAAIGHPARPFDPALRPAAASAEMRRLLTALAVAGFAATNVMLLSISVWSGNVTDITPENRDFFHAVSALIALPAVAIAGRPFFSKAWSAMRGGTLTMDLPIAVGVTLATAYSFFNTITHAREAYFDSALMLLFFLLIGRVLDETMRRRTALEAGTLAALRAEAAVKIEPDGALREIAVSAVAPGDLILLRPGERVPVDGVVTQGQSTIDASLVTGETLPVSAGPGSQLYAGTCNGAGALTLRAEAPGRGSFLDEIERLLSAAGDVRAGRRHLADRVTRAYAPVVHVAALATFVGWRLAGADWHVALASAIAVLIITCPCAVALAVPAVQMVTAGLLFRRRVLLHAGDAIERLADADTVIFDKTGTLTAPTLEMANPMACDPVLLRQAGALAALSRHPLAEALHRATGSPPALMTEARDLPAQGLETHRDGRRLRLGNPTFCGVDPERLAAMERLHPDASFVAYREGDDPPAIFAFTQSLRPDAAAVVETLRQRAYAIEILSGDRSAAVASVARRLKIADWQAELTPADKIARLDALRRQGAKVLMVGDGLNDAPALRAAHVSMSPVTGARLTQTSADAVFLGDGLDAIVFALATSRQARRAMNQNLVFALAYNGVAIPFAILGHASPLLAALTMSCSSLVVTLNALRLRLAVRDAPSPDGAPP